MRGTATKQGWARKPYFVSKALETTMTIALARENPAYYINACCPGWVETDLGNQAGKAPKTVGKRKILLSFICLRLPAAGENTKHCWITEDGAKIPIRVGFGEIGGATGKYWANDEIWGKGEGKVQAW